MIEKEPATDHSEDIAKIWDSIKRLKDEKCDLDIFEARLAKVNEYLDEDQDEIDVLKKNVGKGPRSGKRST